MNSIIDYCRKWRWYFVSSMAFSLLLLVNAGCKKNTHQVEVTEEKGVVADTLPQDFITFFDQFHSDSAYQLAHINFPLEGLPNSITDDSALDTTKYYWKKEDWKIHKPFTDPSHQFDQWYEVFGDRMIEHWIHMKGTNLFLRRRFAKLDNGWYLIYYAGMRPNTAKMEEGK